MKNQTVRSGTLGWLRGGKRGMEAYLFLLHRMTGLVLLAFLSLHVLVTSSRLFGEQAWEWAMGISQNPFVKVAEYAVFAAFVFHAFNGLRLVAIEMGFVIGRPEQPVFPYKGSISRQRPLTIAMMVLAGILIVAGGFEILRFAG